MSATESPSPRDLAGAVWRRGLRDAIHQHMLRDPCAEVGGFLLGTQQADGRLRLEDAVPFSGRGDGRPLSIGPEDWVEAHADLQQLPEDTRIVGWYLSCPGQGARLSSRARFLHESFFSAPFQIAYVVDPATAQEAVFGWRGGEMAALGAGPAPWAPAAPVAPVAVAAPAPRHRRPALASAYALLAAVGVLLGSAVALATGAGRHERAPEPSRVVVTTPASSQSQSTPTHRNAP